MKRLVIFTISFVIILIPFFFETPPGLTEEGFKALSVFFVCVFWWITNVVPLMITSLLAIILFPILGLDSSSEVYAYFGNTAVFFLIGSFILSSAFKRSKLTLKIALGFSKNFGKSSKLLAVSFQYAATFLSFWMSSHAVVAIFLPIIAEIADEMEEVNDGQQLVKTLFLSTLWGATIGGNTTLLGGARGPLALAILNSATSKTVSFSQWTMAVFPITLFLSLITTLLILKITPKVDVKSVNIFLDNKAKELGKLTKKQIEIAFVMVIAIFMWIVFGNQLGLANIALAAVVVLFMLRLISWREVEEDVNWGVILMYGGAIVLGQMLNKTGVSNWLISITKLENLSPVLFITMIVVISIVLTEMMSNSAAVVILMQLALPLASKLNLPVEMIAVLIPVSTGFAFSLPMSSPSVALTLSTGYVELKDTVRYGLFFNLVSMISMIVFANIFWKFIF